MFTETYAHLYDLIHGSKNYFKEVNEILRISELENVKNLRGFDLGCGTGSHAAEFFKLGVVVDGFDVSKDMLTVAKSRYPNLNFSDSLNDFPGEYDFSYSLFDVLSYQTNESELGNLLLNLFDHTKSGGICLVDSWNSKGVRLDPPRLNERVVNSKSGEISRKVTPDLSCANQDTYGLHIDLAEMPSGKILKNELHILRAWSPSEVINIMEKVGFRNLSIYNPTNPKIEFSEFDWRFGIKAKKP